MKINLTMDYLSEGPYTLQVMQQLQENVFPHLGSRLINEITQKEIIAAWGPLWKAGKETGRKLRGSIERIFAWTISREIVKANPTPSSRVMPKFNHNVKHMPSLSYERTPEFWNWSMNKPRLSMKTQTGLAMALLLAIRRQEPRFLGCGHIDLDKAIWVTPADRMKKRKDHRQPLTESVLTML